MAHSPFAGSEDDGLSVVCVDGAEPVVVTLAAASGVAIRDEEQDAISAAIGSAVADSEDDVVGGPECDEPEGPGEFRGVEALDSF